ncbi:MAG: hypothetical protein LV473_21315 [Nitrospira sp.]|nr:hypothetical protein [Nitrospira sp.]
MAAASGFAFLINRTRRQPDAQLPNRQAAGWIMILVSLGITIALGARVLSSFGSTAGVASLVLAVLAGGLFVLLAGRD